MQFFISSLYWSSDAADKDFKRFVVHWQLLLKVNLNMKESIDEFKIKLKGSRESSKKGDII